MKFMRCILLTVGKGTAPARQTTNTTERTREMQDEMRPTRCEDCGDEIEVDGRFRTLCSCDAAE
ncbi:hypothetical protein GA0115255_122272 [Streptomyces sp. Ncost-T6T-2b]|nr:hypothetical protein GA0115255_122272 [Streptomyces sp. Ncost-T6T-2b]